MCVITSYVTNVWFSEAACVIINVIKSLYPINGFELYCEQDIGVLFDHYADALDQVNRGKVIDESRKSVQELRHIIKQRMLSDKAVADAPFLEAARKGATLKNARKRSIKKKKKKKKKDTQVWTTLKDVTQCLASN